MKPRHHILFLILIFALAIAAAAQSDGDSNKGKSNSSVVVKYDKKKDITTVRLKPFRVTRLILEKEAMTSIPLHQTDLEISYTFAGQTATKPVTDVTFKFQVSSNNYIFLRDQAVIAVLDKGNDANGRAFALGNTDYKSLPPIVNSVFSEVLVVAAPSDALTKMAKATSLEIYLGPVGYTISKNQLDAIKELAGFLPNPAS